MTPDVLLLLVFGDGGVGGGFDTFFLGAVDTFFLDAFDTFFLGAVDDFLGAVDAFRERYFVRIYPRPVFENEYYVRLIK